MKKDCENDTVDAGADGGTGGDSTDDMSVVIDFSSSSPNITGNDNIMHHTYTRDSFYTIFPATKQPCGTS